MANKKRAIGAIIKLDGENAFKSSVKNCRSSLAAMHSSLKNIQASYAGNANSLEALSAVQEKYAEMQSTAKEQVEKMSIAYEKSREAQQKRKKQCCRCWRHIKGRRVFTGNERQRRGISRCYKPAAGGSR